MLFMFSIVTLLYVLSGKRYTARVAPQHLRAFVNLGTLIARDESRLQEADQVPLKIDQRVNRSFFCIMPQNCKLPYYPR